MLRLKRESLALFPELVAELSEETGVDVGYRSEGVLEIALSERDDCDLRKVVSKRLASGEPVRLLDGREMREIDGLVSEAARVGAYFPGDCALDSEALVRALYQSAQKLGVEFVFDSPVGRVEKEERRLRVVEAGERRFEPGEVVIAAGLGSRELGTMLRAKMPIRGDRGEMIALRPLVLPRQTTVWRQSYLVPRAGGELFVGSTSARGETENKTTDESLQLLRGFATRMMPALADAPVSRHWSGIRPMCTLRRPIIGPIGGYENVTAATGHHRNGILLAPITAKLVAECVLDRQTSIALAPFKYRKKP